MPKGPRGERRPADTFQAANLVARIATGEIEEKRPKTKRTRSGKAGAKARAEKLTPERRAAIAKKAAEARWEK
jgi:hypothetical protein